MTIQRLWVQGEEIWHKDQLSDKEKDLIYKFGLVSNATAVKDEGNGSHTAIQQKQPSSTSLSHITLIILIKIPHVS